MTGKRKPLYRAKPDVFPRLDRDQLQARLTAALAQLDGDEVVVLTLIAERLALEKRRYGQLDLTRDGRNLPRECLEEVLDGLVYATAALLQRGGSS